MEEADLRDANLAEADLGAAFLDKANLSGAILRVCPGTLGGVAELSQHQADGSETQKGKRLAVEIFPILGQPAAAVEPGEGALDNPAFG